MTSPDKTGSDKQQKPSAKAQAMAARLMAVQALYQNQQNQKPVGTLVKEYIEYRAGMEIDGEAMVEPDGVLMKKIVDGVHQRHEELNEIIAGHTKKSEDGKSRETEPLLKAILLAGTYELLAHQDIDFPVIINDYINVTHAFYDSMEAGLVNGVLDPIAKLLRA
ncbi:MAG: N utilization substance protein B [Micavibrio sp.]|nr:MAG: N utilization substance protein B [Micavibrio sp.]